MTEIILHEDLVRTGYIPSIYGEKHEVKVPHFRNDISDVAIDNESIDGVVGELEAEDLVVGGDISKIIPNGIILFSDITNNLRKEEKEIVDYLEELKLKIYEFDKKKGSLYLIGAVATLIPFIPGIGPSMISGTYIHDKKLLRKLEKTIKELEYFQKTNYPKIRVLE